MRTLDFTPAATRRAILDFSAGFSAYPVTTLTAVIPRYLHLQFCAIYRVFERYFYLSGDIRSSLWSGRLASSPILSLKRALTEASSEKRLKNIGKAAKSPKITKSCPGRRLLKAGLAESVVSRAFARVAKHLVGFSDLLEFFF
jgi:hypothetical protein